MRFGERRVEFQRRLELDDGLGQPPGCGQSAPEHSLDETDHDEAGTGQGIKSRQEVGVKRRLVERFAA